MQSGNWWLSWTFIAVTPADPHIIIVVVIATGDDVIVTWPAGARLVAATSRHIPARVAVTLTMPIDVTAAAAVRSCGGEDEAIDGNMQR